MYTPFVHLYIVVLFIYQVKLSLKSYLNPENTQLTLKNPNFLSSFKSIGKLSAEYNIPEGRCHTKAQLVVFVMMFQM